MVLSFDILLISAVIFFIAALVHGSIGFGFPMIATPLLALFVDIQSAIILTLIPTLLMNIVSIASEADFKLSAFYEAIKRHYVLASYALIGTIVGTFVLLSTDSDIFKLLLSFAILIYLISDQIKLNMAWLHRYPKVSKLVFGLSAGLLGGLTNVMAPVLIIYSLALNRSKRDIIQASNLCFLFGKITQICLFTYSSKFTSNELSISSLMFVVSAVAITLGIQIKKRIEVNAYIGLLKVLLLCLAIIIILQLIFERI